MTGEGGERLTSRGPRGPRGSQGNQGERGERGEQGMTIGARRAVIYLFVLTVVLAALNLFWTAHSVHASQAAVQAAQHREQVLQQQAGVILGRKLCMTFGALAALKPPAGSAAANPSRAYLQAQHDKLAQLGTDLGCGKGT